MFKNYVFAPESKLSKVQFQKCCSDKQTWKIGGRNSNFSDVPIEFSNFSWNELIRENMIKFPLLSVLLLQFFVPYVEATFPGSCFNFEVHSTWVSRRSFTSRKKALFLQKIWLMIKKYENGMLIVLNFSARMNTVFENQRKTFIQHCERSELSLHFEWTKVHKNANNSPIWRFFENLKLAVKQCYQTGQF